MLNKNEPLWLPPGSIRSVIALGVVTAFIFQQVPIEIATLVLGFYFAVRPNAGQDAGNAPPPPVD